MKVRVMVLVMSDDKGAEREWLFVFVMVRDAVDVERMKKIIMKNTNDNKKRKKETTKINNMNNKNKNTKKKTI